MTITGALAERKTHGRSHAFLKSRLGRVTRWRLMELVGHHFEARGVGAP